MPAPREPSTAPLDARLQVKLPRLRPAPFTLSSIKGLRAAGVCAGIKASGKPDVGLLVADKPMACAGIFTQNKLAAAPVQLSREHLDRTGGRVRAVVVNSGNANACTGTQGDKDARAMCQKVARALGCPVEEVLVCSTGVIGRPMPMKNVQGGIEAALHELSGDGEAGRRFLAAIMTTDAFPKEAGRLLHLSGKDATVAGVCKGAGMIQPNMATMLAFLATDLALGAPLLRDLLPKIAAQSFNAVHVDTHPSTNDTLLLLSTGRVRPGPMHATAAQIERAFLRPINDVARRLAWLIARDGEGATKVTTIDVRGAASDEAARAVAGHVAMSALVRTALYGNDPNWGRFVSQVGNCPAVKSVAGLRCVLQGITVFRDGEPTDFDRAAASRAMAKENVALRIELSEGRGRAALMTSDLGYKYVEINAEYTT